MRIVISVKVNWSFLFCKCCKVKFYKSTSFLHITLQSWRKWWVFISGADPPAIMETERCYMGNIVGELGELIKDQWEHSERIKFMEHCSETWQYSHFLDHNVTITGFKTFQETASLIWAVGRNVDYTSWESCVNLDM